jgi:prefoldin subunit 5
MSDELKDEIERLQGEIERLREIVSEVENLHYGTDLFTSCAAGEADRLIELTESEVGDE